MSKNSGKLLTTVLHGRDIVEQAYKIILSHGYTKDNISILMSKETRDNDFANTDLPQSTIGSTKAIEGLGVGSAIGGAIGGVAAAIAAIGTVLSIPGLGLVIAGPLAASLAGAGAGSIAGGLTGALVGSGISDDLAREYEDAIKEGGVVLIVECNSDEDNTSLRNSLSILSEELL